MLVVIMTTGAGAVGTAGSAGMPGHLASTVLPGVLVTTLGAGALPGATIVPGVTRMCITTTIMTHTGLGMAIIRTTARVMFG